MTKITITLALAALAAAATGCVASKAPANADISHFALADSGDNDEMTREIRLAFGLEPASRRGEWEPGVSDMPKREIKAEFPAVMAIVTISDGSNGTPYSSGCGWRFSAPDPETTEIIEKELKNIDAIKGIEPMPSFGGHRPGFTGLRRQAAALGADLLFVFTTNTVVEDYYNPAGWGYLSGVGLFCIPGNTVLATAAAQGILLDVKSGFPLGVVTVKSKKKGVAIAAVNLGEKYRSYRTQVSRECDEKMAQGLAGKIVSHIATTK